MRAMRLLHCSDECYELINEKIDDKTLGYFNDLRSFFAVLQ